MCLGRFKRKWKQSSSCLALVVLELGHVDSSRPQPGLSWALLAAACCPLYIVDLRAGGILNTGFYSAECSSDLVGRQFGALLEACFISKETEVGSSVHSQSSEQVALRQALRSAPLGRAACLLEENARWWEAYRPCWESDFHTRNWRSLRKILRKLRSYGPSRASPRHCLFSPRSFTSVPLETGTSNTFLEGKLLMLLRWFRRLILSAYCERVMCWVLGILSPFWFAEWLRVWAQEAVRPGMEFWLCLY